MNADKTLLTPLCKRLGATLSRRGMLFVGLGIVIIMSAAALLAPWLSPYDPTALHLKTILVPPSAQFPSFILILAVIAFLEPSLNTIMVVIGLTSWMGVARLVRAETLSLRERDFVAAARLAGTRPFRIMVMHILPNALTPVLVSATLGIAGAILVESSLSFLGLGVQPPDPSWGNMLMEGKDVLEIAPWLSLYPGLAILITVLGYNLLGESLRDTLDPRLKR